MVQSTRSITLIKHLFQIEVKEDLYLSSFFPHAFDHTSSFSAPSFKKWENVGYKDIVYSKILYFSMIKKKTCSAIVTTHTGNVSPLLLLVELQAFTGSCLNLNEDVRHQ